MTAEASTIRGALAIVGDLISTVRRTATERNLNMSHATITFSVEGKRYQAVYDQGEYRVMEVPAGVKTGEPHG